MGDRKTRVVVEAEAKGFEKTRRAAKETFRTLGDGKKVAKDMDGLDKTVGEVSKSLKGLRNAFKDLDRVMGSARGKRAIREIRQEVRLLAQDLQKISGGGGGGGSANRRGFAMGVLQGAGVGEYFPSQGMGANVAGRALGRGARGAGRMAQSFGVGAFSGSSGFAQGLAGIPVVGGFMAGQFSNLISTAQIGLGARQQRASMQGLVSPFGMADRISGARGRAAGRNGIFSVNEGAIAGAGQLAAEGVGQANAQAKVRALMDTVATGKLGMEETGFFSSAPGTQERLRKIKARDAIQNDPGLQKTAARLATAEISAARKQGETEERANQEKMRRSSINRRRHAMNRAESRERRRPFDVLTNEGINMGIYDPTQARQFGGQLATTMGGGLGQFQGGAGRGFLRSAIAAQTTFGLGANVTGAFGRAGNLGAIKGGLGGADAAMARTIGDALALGLEGSDLQNYMQQTAQSLMSFERTGIALNPEAAGRISSTMGMNGLGAIRGGAVGRGMLAAGGRMSQSGPQNAIELMMFQDMFGFKGGGLEGYAAAQRRAETGQVEVGGVERFLMNTLSGAQGAGEGQMRLQAVFGKLGISVGATEMHRMAGGDPEGLAAARDKITAAMDRRAKMREAGGLTGLAGGIVDPLLQKKARLQQTKEGVGERMAGTALEFERGQTAALKNFSKLAPEMKKAATALSNLADKGSGRIVEIIERVEKLLGVYEAVKGVPK